MNRLILLNVSLLFLGVTYTVAVNVKKEPTGRAAIDPWINILKDKLQGRMQQVNKADATERIDTPYENRLNFYRYRKQIPSSPGTSSSIQTCLAVPPSVTIGVYALKAAGGTLFLRHRVDDICLSECFRKYRFETLIADSFKSCADAVESSGWANSFSFVNNECVGQTAWMHSKYTQGSVNAGDQILYAAENKINNFTDYSPPEVMPTVGLARMSIQIFPTDGCQTAAKIKVSSQMGSQTFNKPYLPIYYEQFNSDLCKVNPPEIAKTANVTAYDHDGKVIWQKKTVLRDQTGFNGTMHLFSGDYGNLCLSHGTSSSSDSGCAPATAFRETSFFTYKKYRDIISQIPGVTNHYVSARYGSNKRWNWEPTGRPVGAENFVPDTVPTSRNALCLIANYTQDYLLEPSICYQTNDIVCVAFSAIFSFFD